MQKKVLFLALILSALTFVNCLYNGFVGDDEVFIVHNAFYRSWDNVGSLFTKDYFPNPQRKHHMGENYYSGSVAYRPVLSLTYFLDYWLWKLKPFGYHLKNLELHLLNVVLVYFLLSHLISHRKIVFFATLLFGVHPIQTEAVSNIGYRADLLATCFTLGSFLLFTQFANRLNYRKLFYSGSLICFALALFSKESAIVLPALLIMYECFFRRYALADVFKNLFTRYLGFVLVALFYIYVYMIIFPNQTMGTAELMGGSLKNHFISMLLIFTQYVVELCLPFMVKMIPPLYAPSIQPYAIDKISLGICLVIGYIILIVTTFRGSRRLTFFLLWFLICLLPVSNLVPLINPMAHRFLYLPSIGILAAIAMFVERWVVALIRTKKFPDLGNIIKFSFLGLCIAMSISTSSLWRSSYMVGLTLTEHYPHHDKSHAILGTEYFKMGQYQKAMIPLKRAMELGSQDPRVYELYFRSQKLSQKTGDQ